MWQQEEAGVVEDNETTLKQWPCSSCTFLNHFAVPSCEMCAAPSHLLSEQPFITQQRDRRLYSANDADSDEDELGDDDFEDIDEDERYLSERAYDRNPSKRDYPLHRGTQTTAKPKPQPHQHRRRKKISQPKDAEVAQTVEEVKPHRDEKGKEKERAETEKKSEEDGIVSNIPVEMLYFIFQFLRVQDLFVVAKVCHLWNTIAKDRQLMAKKALTVRYHLPRNEKEVQNRIVRKTKKRMIEGIVVTAKSKGFVIGNKLQVDLSRIYWYHKPAQDQLKPEALLSFKKTLPDIWSNVTSLLFDGCQLTPAALLMILKEMGWALRGFFVRNNYGMNFGPTGQNSNNQLELPNLVSLELSSKNSDAIPLLLKGIRTPNLRHLKVNYTGNLYHSSARYNWENRLGLLAHCQPIALQSVTIPLPHLDDLHTIVKSSAASLTSLDLLQCSTLQTLNLGEMPKLQHIGIHSANNLRAAEISTIISNLSKNGNGILTLKLKDATHLNPEHLHQLADSNGGKPIALTNLDLSACLDIDEKSLVYLLNKSPSLRSLRLRNFDVLSPKFFKQLASKCPFLEELVSVRNPHLDGTFEFSHPNLRILHLRQSFAMTHIHLDCPNLTELNLSTCKNLKDDLFESLKKGTPRLTRLNIVNNPQFSFEAIDRFLCSVPLISEAKLKDTSAMRPENLELLTSHLQSQKRTIVLCPVDRHSQPASQSTPEEKQENCICM